MLLIAAGFILSPIMKREKNHAVLNSQGKRIVILCALGLPLFAFSLYLKWGQSNELAKQYEQQEKLTKLRKELGSPQEVIDKLKQQLERSPNSAEGWYLLAKLYFSQQQFNDAANAYARLNQLKPNDTDVLVQYAQALYFANEHRMTAQITRLLHQVLKQDPEQTLAINLLAIDAYQHQAYQQAIGYWQKLLNQYPPNSDEYQSISTAIDNAQKALQQATKPASSKTIKLAIDVNIALSLQTLAAPNDIVFIYARDADGSAMPLAITRIQASELPKRIILSQLMAMNPAKTLTDAKRIIVIARISKSGNAMPIKGDLQGASKTLAIEEAMAQPIKLTISERVP